ncbi:MAG: hypothetical protein RI983_408 [Bacteroidota bacterium]|jgi:hypothetical protein|uniref:DUF721 domain-containing protein n=1 Tax=Sediminibacterium sp. C3 TaxID=1267211 RepID=UPI00041EBC66|nr:DUF721 domain-containing protein [Sediminibacterium sp. C3]
MGEVKIGDAFKQLKGLNHLKKGIRSAQIEDIWEQLMGKTVAKYTEKIQIIQKKLFIHTPIGPLKNELNFQKPQIIARVNEAFGEEVIEEVIIQ